MSLLWLPVSFMGLSALSNLCLLAAAAAVVMVEIGFDLLFSKSLSTQSSFQRCLHIGCAPALTWPGTSVWQGEESSLSNCGELRSIGGVIAFLIAHHVDLCARLEDCSRTSLTCPQCRHQDTLCAVLASGGQCRMLWFSNTVNAGYGRCGSSSVTNR